MVLEVVEGTTVIVVAGRTGNFGSTGNNGTRGSGGKYSNRSS